MKKILVSVSIAAVTLGLTACGNASQQSSKSSSSTASSKVAKKDAKVDQYSTEEFALMAYLQYSNQKVKNVANSAQAIDWQKQDEQYLAVANGQRLTIKVHKDRVQVAGGNNQKSYAKEELVKQFPDKKALKQALADLTKQPTASTSSASDQQSQQTQQSTAQSASQQAPDNGQVMIAGHSFHHADFYGNDILVGDHNEGEGVEYFANDPTMNQAQRESAMRAVGEQEHTKQN